MIMCHRINEMFYFKKIAFVFYASLTTISYGMQKISLDY